MPYLLTEEEIDLLLNKIVEDPLRFETTDFYRLTNAENASIIFYKLRHYVCRIFDINETILLKESVSDNLPNRKSQHKRARKFYDTFRSGFDRSQDGNKLIVAEGDSWFEFPFFIDDIIDHLNDNDRYKIYSLAYGGDWLTNIIYEGQYVEALSVLNPDVFLVSGGGNDLVGSNRLGLMVGPKIKCECRYESISNIRETLSNIYGPASDGITNESDLAVFFEIQGYVRKEFYSFLWIMKLQYTLMFQGIRRKHKSLRIITQGYDYAIPSPLFHGSWVSRQYWVNKLLKTGRWLYIPLAINGFTDPIFQRNLIRYMIFEFNLMFASIATTEKNVYHIDCRGVADGPEDWYDELHLVSHKFAQVARAYRACIDSQTPWEEGTKIYFARTC